MRLRITGSTLRRLLCGSVWLIPVYSAHRELSSHSTAVFAAADDDAAEGEICYMTGEVKYTVELLSLNEEDRPLIG